ncbi:MAG: type II secretion system protein [Firmicutes bacterium]|nr:type II secretion system protein [Bacillota bacterium]
MLNAGKVLNADRRKLANCTRKVKTHEGVVHLLFFGEMWMMGKAVQTCTPGRIIVDEARSILPEPGVTGGTRALLVCLFRRGRSRQGFLPAPAGFTLLELILVIAIMSFLVAIITPLVGFADTNQKVRATRERLEEVRTALLGPRGAYDAEGLRVVGGYVGDRDRLPLLHRSIWNDVYKRWDWPDRDSASVVEDNYGTGQPLSLWEEVYAEKEDWKGPYLPCPRDEYPDDAAGLDWNNPAEKREFEMRQTGGKLADAWGRALLFWKEGSGPGTTLWIISEGPDRKSGWRDAGGNPVLPGDERVDHYDPTAQESKDDVVLKITPEEWYSPNRAAREERTRQILERIRSALLGPPDACDAAGRRIIGGYLGDVGSWPKLYKWDESQSKWVEDALEGQPRGLWDSGCAPTIPDSVYGFAWRGPYLTRPWGEGKDEVLRDAWGEPLRFTLEAGGILTIASAGRDKNFDTPDDIKTVIAASAWQVAGVVLRGKVANETGDGVDVEVSLCYQPEGKTVSSTVYVPPGGSSPFVLEVPSGDYTCGGARLARAVLTSTGEEKNRAVVFIGVGGTQSPAEDKLVLTIR